MYGYIYLTTNKINGKQYVGQHTTSTFDPNYKGSGIVIKAAIKKYGFDNFECHIIDTAESQEELDDKEYVYVELFQTLITGYNRREGGGSKGKLSEETKKLISKKFTGIKRPDLEGENNPMYGKGYLIAGEKHPMYGKHHTEVAKQKISEGISGGKNGRAKKCIFDGKTFSCIKDAVSYATTIGIKEWKCRKELKIL